VADTRAPSYPQAVVQAWPELPYTVWQDTYATLHLWTQIVGKIRLAQCSLCNHWWNIPLYVTARGLGTSPSPYKSSVFEMDFDFVDHQLRILAADGRQRAVALAPRSVADFYQHTMSQLRSLGIEVAIWTTPVEIADRTPFEQDHKHAAYDPTYVERFLQALQQVDRVLKAFRGRFLGKVSPVQFFWGSFDLAVTRFSGRRAPDHPASPNVGRFVMLEAYSHEVSSAGFWPGAGFGEPAFYSYAYPEPAGMRDYPVQPKEARYNKDFGEFLLPYDAVRLAPAPDQALLDFLQSTYEAAANLAHWDRAALERRSPIGA
jgi:hypothetical protein